MLTVSPQQHEVPEINSYCEFICSGQRMRSGRSSRRQDRRDSNNIISPFQFIHRAHLANLTKAAHVLRIRLSRDGAKAGNISGRAIIIIP